ncbi:hypothetical protein HDV06_003401 [Boothiomyces sp. JEL0866]|nr:hypothetical protein HDV06_003353 [Boothiomyces sp. JEL0866]KAJ3325631.1 hypothetical protein HDV06_003401 [Boothiomyces sp. JEL0866]
MGKKRSRKKEKSATKSISNQQELKEQLQKASPTVIDIPNNNHLEIKTVNSEKMNKPHVAKNEENNGNEAVSDSSKKKKKKRKKRSADKADRADEPQDSKITKKPKLEESLTAKKKDSANGEIATASSAETPAIKTLEKKVQDTSSQTSDINNRIDDIQSLEELKKFILNTKTNFADVIRSLLKENDSLIVKSGKLEKELKESKVKYLDLSDVEQKMMSCHICMDVSEPRKTEILERIKEEKEAYSTKKDPWHPWKKPVQYIIDHDDGVTRCGTCGWEIENGVCENCNARYPDLDRGENIEDEEELADDHEDSMDTEDEQFVVDDDYIEYESDASQAVRATRRNQRNTAENRYEDSDSDSAQIISVRNNVIDVSDESSESNVKVARVSRNSRNVAALPEFSDEELESTSSKSDRASLPEFSEPSSSDDEYSNQERNELVEFSAEEDNYEDSSSD